MQTRKNTSRSKELDIVIYSFRLEIEKFKKLNNYYALKVNLADEGQAN